MPAIMETWLVRQLHLLGGDHEAFVVSGGPIRLNLDFNIAKVQLKSS